MATKTYPTPIEVSQTLSELGERIALRRRMHGLTQADLAERVGVGLASIVSLEGGGTGVATGTLARVLWGLDGLADLDAVAKLTADDGLIAGLVQHIPKRVRSKKLK